MTTLADELAALDFDPEEDVERQPAGPRPGPRGWAGRGRGRAVYVQAPVRWRGTSVQVCGLWPWAAGSSAPLIGVPLGRIMAGRTGSGSTLCCDPLSWFGRANLISRPSAFIEGEPGMGKSALVKRISLGLAGMGVNTLVVGDLKREYVTLIKALGGQVVPLGPGRGYINVLDNSAAKTAAERIGAAAGRAEALAAWAACDADEAARAAHETEALRLRGIRAAVLADAHTRRTAMVTALLTIQRHRPPEDREESILDRAIRWLDVHFPGVPVLDDLLRVIRAAPEEVRAVAIDRGSLDRYKEITEGLEASLVGLMGHGRLGETFAQQTSEELRIDRSAVFDISAIDPAQTDLKAAALMACWSAGFGMVNIATALAEAGLEPQRNYLVVLDELWQALRAAPGIVDLVDSLTRLDRNTGVGQIMVTHSLADLNALSEIDRMKARGFAERAGMVIAAGLPRSEMPLLTSVIGLSAAEQELLTSWSSPPAWDTSGREVPPPGRGNFLVKVGGRPGIPFHVELTAPELALNDTNQRWRQWTARGAPRGDRVMPRVDR